MTKLSCALALCLLAPSLASANELTRIYELAVDNDTQLRAAAGARDAAIAGNPRARGALLPQITGTNWLVTVPVRISFLIVSTSGSLPSR